MPYFKNNLTSKQPGTSASIFAVMSKLAAENNAINLSQGFPDFQISGKMTELVHQYMKKGYNQYAPMPGVPELRQAIARKVTDMYGVNYDPETEITITAGATEALFAAISAFVREGDEVIVFEPAYDSYAPAVKINGGTVKYALMKYPDYHIEWDEVKRLISHKTRMIIINTPHNPTGSVLKAADMKALEKLTTGTDIIVLSDEVYEHLIFDGIRHESACLYPGLLSRSLIVASFGKTFHATGWKMGYCMGPANLTEEFRKAHQWIVFAVNTPIQYAMAEFLSDKQNYAELHHFYQEKRDFFASLLQASRFKLLPCSGTYFQLVDYSSITDEEEKAFAVRLTKEHKVGAIPVSVFYHKAIDNKVLRLCFAKKNETMEKAAEILCRI